MSIEFSTALSSLRKEKNISQKDAAEALGVSQALLSHYEKGIRECSLDFVKKAAEFYNVTSDYLLGINTSKYNTSEISNPEIIDTDTSINLNTILRSIKFFSEVAENDGDEAKIFFDNYFSLTIKKYFAITNENDNKTAKLCEILCSPDFNENIMTDKILDKATLPLSVKTIEQHCNMLISKYIENLI